MKKIALALAVLPILVALAGCQSTRNITLVYVEGGSTATITLDGGSAAKPFDIGRGLSASIPMGGLIP